MNRQYLQKSLRNSYSLKKVIPLSIGILFLLPRVSSAQLVIDPQPYISLGGTTVGPISCTGGSVSAPCYSYATLDRAGTFPISTTDVGMGFGGTQIGRWNGTNFILVAPLFWEATANGGGDTSLKRLSAGDIQATHSALAVTPDDAFIYANDTASTAGVPVQISPALRLRSHVWNTTAVAADNTDDWRIYTVPVSGLVPSSTMLFRNRLNGGAYTTAASLKNNGVLTGLIQVGLASGMLTSATVAGGNGLVARTAADDSNAAIEGTKLVADTSIFVGANVAFTSTIPTLTSGFNDGGGTPATITGTSTAFRIAVGNGTGDTVGVIGLPTATTFWNCFIADQTTPLDITRQTGSTTSAATFTSTLAWTAGDVLIGNCVAQ